MRNVIFPCLSTLSPPQSSNQIHPSSISFDASSQFSHPDGDTILIWADFANRSEIGHNGRLEVRRDRLVFQRLLLWMLAPWRFCECWKAATVTVVAIVKLFAESFQQTFNQRQMPATNSCVQEWWLSYLSWSPLPRLAGNWDDAFTVWSTLTGISAIFQPESYSEHCGDLRCASLHSLTPS